jgi:2'-5' RNA ligase
VRAFIAIDLEPGLKSALEALVRSLEATRAEVRWARPNGTHLTLKFLGEIDGSRAGQVTEALEHVARRHKSFGLRLEGTGAFPNESSPRVLWVGVTADPGLAELQDDLEKALEVAGFPREERPFKPHLTLGRVKGRARLDRAMAELEAHRRDDLGGMTVRKVALFESRLRPQGAEYRIVREVELG